MSRLSDLEFDTECLLESFREQIPRLAMGKKEERSEMRLQMLVAVDSFLLKWFPRET